MSLYEEIFTQDFQKFIQYGSLMSAFAREEMVNWLVNFFYHHGFSDLNGLKKTNLAKQFDSWGHIVERFVRENTFRAVTLGNKEISKQALSDITSWMEKSHRKVIKNDVYCQEFQVLQINRQKRDPKTWYPLLENLEKNHPEERKTWQFYEEKLQSLQKQISEAKRKNTIKQELETVCLKIAEDWEKALQAKQDRLERKILDQEFDSFISQLNAKYEKLLKLYQSLAPFFGFFGKYWDLSQGAWQQLDWNQLEKYAEILKQEKALQELAELLGKYQAEESEFEKEIIQKTVIKNEWKVNHANKSEIVGIHFSDDLNSLLPSQTALLSNPLTEVVFAKNFVEKKLLTWHYQGKTISTKEIQEPEEKAKEDKKGPIIVCVDTSGSMHGEPERIAKTLVFAILSIALKEKRKCYLISFSTQIKTIDLSDLQNSLPKLIEFLSMSFHGGTDATPAFIEALRMLKTKHYKKADVLMVSDFVMPSLPDNTILNIKKAQENKTRLHCLIIEQLRGHYPVKDIFDSFWVYDKSSRDALQGTVKYLRSLYGEKHC